MLKDSQARQADDDGRDHLYLPKPILRGDLLVTEKGDESCDHGNQTDRRVKSAEWRQTKHVDFLSGNGLGTSATMPAGKPIP
jgi:hypothetical protein